MTDSTIGYDLRLSSLLAVYKEFVRQRLDRVAIRNQNCYDKSPELHNTVRHSGDFFRCMIRRNSQSKLLWKGL